MRITALDGNRALVVGGGLFGPWSIWVDAGQLGRSAPEENHMNSSTPASSANRAKPLSAIETQEQRARELDWENEGGRVRKDETGAAQAPRSGNLADDNGADAP